LPSGAILRLGTLRFQHGDRILFAAFDRTGKTIITASEDQTIRLWDSASGKEIRRFDRPVNAKEKEVNKGVGETQRVMDTRGDLKKGYQIALSPDGNILAATREQMVIVWEMATGKELHRFRGSSLAWITLAFTADSSALMLTDPMGEVSRWDLKTGKKSRLCQLPVGQVVTNVNSTSFSPDGTIAVLQKTAVVLTVKSEEDLLESLVLYSTASGKELARIDKAVLGITGRCFSPNNKVLAWGTVKGQVRLWDWAGGMSIHVLGPAGRSQVRSLAFSPDGKVLAVTRTNQAVELWDAVQGKQLHQFGSAPAAADGHTFGSSTPPQSETVFSPDGRTLASGCSGSGLRLFDVATGKEITSGNEGHRAAVGSVRLAPDGKTLTTHARGDAIRVWQLATGKELRRLPVPGNSVCEVLSPNGTVLASVERNAPIKLHDLATGKILRVFGRADEVTSALAFSADRRTLAVLDNSLGVIRLWNAATGEPGHALGDGREPSRGGPTVPELVEVPAGAHCLHLSFSPDGKYLAAPTGRSHHLGLWNVQFGSKVREFQLTRNQVVKQIAFSGDGRTLATMNQDGTSTLYEVATGKARCQLGKVVRAPEAPGFGFQLMGRVFDISSMGAHVPYAVAFSPSGRYLAAANNMATIQLWNLVTGKQERLLKGHEGSVLSLTFSLDGQQLYSGSMDATVLVWDLKDLGKGQPQQAELRDKDSRWADLASQDSTRAFAVMQTLLASPDQAVTLLKNNLKPAVAADQQRVSALLGDLGSRQFTVRERASLELAKMGDLAAGSLRDALRAKPALEVRKRIGDLLKKLMVEELTPDQLRNSRVLELLEQLQNSEARRLLESLARGAAGARLTEDATVSLRRLQSRSR
jgi:WD40 repeat protein